MERNGTSSSHQTRINGTLPSNHTEINGLHKDIEGNASRDQSNSSNYGSITVQKKEDHNLRALTNCQRFSYGVGHVLNDLTASMWFSYLLVFLHQVNSFKNVLAGNLMLIGQISDAICTPFIGFESDRTKGIKKIGKRKTWHLVGTFSVLAAFAFLFTKCITCSYAPDIAQFVYYAPFVVIFQFGWASTQISHLSFSSDITPYKHERVTLQSIRNSFTVIANLSVYGIFILLFQLEGHESSSDELSEKDAPKFQTLAFICLGLGTLFNFVFYFGTKEKPQDCESDTEKGNNAGESSIEQSTLRHSKMSWTCWLKERQFYQIAVLYMATRLYINVSQVYFPMYLTETLSLNKQSIAILPLVTYCSSFLMSFAASYINKYTGRKISYIIGVGIGAASCIWMYLIPKDGGGQVYGAAMLMGGAGSLLLITSLSMTSDLIGSNIESGAFVFGAMSFTDKLSNGVAVQLIQIFHPCTATACCEACGPYYKHIQSFVPGGALVVALIAVLSLLPEDIGNRTKLPPVLQVMENPARSAWGPGSSFTNTHHCSCGTVYTTLGSCPGCGAPANFQNTRSVTHQAEVHRHLDSNDDDDDDSDDGTTGQERKPLLSAKNVNTPPGDVEYYSESRGTPEQMT